MNPNQEPQQPQVIPPQPAPQPVVPPLQPTVQPSPSYPPTPQSPQAVGHAPQPSGPSQMDSTATQSFMNWMKSNPKIKYGFIALVLPLAAIVTLMQGGSIGDIFSQQIRNRELRELVQDEANAHKATYGFRVMVTSDVSCDGNLNNRINSTVKCSIDATRTVGGDIEGQVNVTVRVLTAKTDTSPAIIRLEGITPV